MRNMTYVFMTEESKVIDANEFLDTTDEKILFELRTEIAKNQKKHPCCTV